MSPETNPLRRKESEDLEKQLSGNYESSDIGTQISLVKEELEFLKITLETIDDFGDEDPEGIDALKKKALLDKKNLQEKLEELQEKLVEPKKELSEGDRFIENYPPEIVRIASAMEFLKKVEKGLGGMDTDLGTKEFIKNMEEVISSATDEDREKAENLLKARDEEFQN